MSHDLRTAFLLELGRGSSAGDWKALERAHILSQAYPWPHIVVHWRMFVFALRAGDLRETLGQLIRLLFAGPGSLLGRAPVGNTGGANVGIFQPMGIPGDLREILLVDPRSAKLIAK